MKKLLVLTIAMAILTGCGSLNVKVDVLNPEVIRTQAELDLIDARSPELLTQSEQDITDEFTEIVNDQNAIHEEMARNVAAKAAAAEGFTQTLLNQSACDIRNNFQSNIRERIEETRDDLIGINREIRESMEDFRAANPEAKSVARRRVVHLLKAYDAEARQLKRFLLIEINQQAEVSPDVKEAALRETAESQEIFDSGGFLHSRYAYLVVKAPEKEWAEEFDRALGRGVFGNTDVAIRALGPGNFTIKGMSFNPSDVAQMASKVATQSIMLAAQISGVPVNLSGSSPPASGTTGASLAQSSGRIANLHNEQAQLDANLVEYRSAMLRIAQAILNEQERIGDGDDEVRADAVSAINAIYDSHRNRIAVPTGNQ